jgi:hypothetical protein
MSNIILFNLQDNKPFKDLWIFTVRVKVYYSTIFTVLWKRIYFTSDRYAKFFWAIIAEQVAKELNNAWNVIF